MVLIRKAKTVRRIIKEKGLLHFIQIFPKLFLTNLNKLSKINLKSIQYFFLELKLELKYPKNKVFLKKIHGSKMLLGLKDKGLSRQLLLKGTREQIVVDVYKPLIRKGDVVLEIGANIGYYALMASRIVGSEGKVIAVEPVSENYGFLEKNIELNRYKNMETHKLALGNKKGTAVMNICERRNNSSFTTRTEMETIGTEKVNIKTTDEFLKGKEKPDVVRMDVDGYEYEIIKGMKKTLKENPPRLIFMEFHPGILGQKKAKELLSILKSNGYRINSAILPKHSSNPLPQKIDDLMNNALPRTFYIFFEHKK